MPVPPARTRLTETARRTTTRLGFEVGRPGMGLVPWGVRRSFRPPEPESEGAYWIPLDRVTTFAGFSYREGGWHPYRATVDWLLQHPDGEYQDSPLARYYRRYTPSTISEVIWGQNSAVDPFRAIPAWKIVLIWTLNRRDVVEALGRSSLERGRSVSDHVGPIDERYGSAKLEKLRRLVHSIRTTGYRPAEHPNGVSEGIFLVDDHQYVLLPTEGQHRLAVLAACGIDRVLVRPRSSGPTVRRERLPGWGRTWGIGAEDPRTTEVFRFYFESDGSRTADQWGLR